MSEPTSSVVSGHGLLYEGRLWRYGRVDNGVGAGICSCGDRSPDLQNTAARKQWHRQHKGDVLAALAAEAPR